MPGICISVAFFDFIIFQTIFCGLCRVSFMFYVFWFPCLLIFELTMQAYFSFSAGMVLLSSVDCVYLSLDIHICCGLSMFT